MVNNYMSNLNTLFATHVVEVIAKRRNPPPRFKSWTRRFLCTNSFPLLNSIAGKTAFHFNPPTSKPPYNAPSYNLITVYDLIMQDWRNINLEDYNILGAIPIRNDEEIIKFWEYFNNVLSKMSYIDKKRFMNR